MGLLGQEYMVYNYFSKEVRACYVNQPVHEIVDPSGPPASPFSVAGTTAAHHYVWLVAYGL